LHTQDSHTQHDAKKKEKLVRVQMLMVDSINITVFWDVTECTLVQPSIPHTEAAGTSKMFVPSPELQKVESHRTRLQS
jgi:hypothetical protein